MLLASNFYFYEFLGICVEVKELEMRVQNNPYSISKNSKQNINFHARYCAKSLHKKVSLFITRATTQDKPVKRDSLKFVDSKASSLPESCIKCYKSLLEEKGVIDIFLNDAEIKKLKVALKTYRKILKTEGGLIGKDGLKREALQRSGVLGLLKGFVDNAKEMPPKEIDTFYFFLADAEREANHLLA